MLPARVQPAEDLAAQAQMLSRGRVLVVFRVDVHSHVGDVLEASHERAAHGLADLVALGDADPGIPQDEMHVHQHPMGHAAGAQQMQVLDAVHRLNGFADTVQIGGIQARIDKLAHAALGHVETDLADHDGHYQGRNRVQVGEPQQRAAHTDHDDHRGNGVAARVPGIGAQQLRPEAARVAHGVTVYRLLANHRERRQGDGPGLRHHRRLRIQQCAHAVVGDADSDERQRDAEAGGGGGLDTAMTVGVILIGLDVGVLGGVQHQHIRGQIGKRMHTVGDQGLRMTEPTADDLDQAEREIHRGSHQGHAAHLTIALVQGRACDGFSHKGIREPRSRLPRASA